MPQWFLDMSELQVSLIAIGIAVVIGVVFLNWMQQRRYRRKAEEAFGGKHEDVLLGAGASVEIDERIEPQLGKELHDSQADTDAQSILSPETVQQHTEAAFRQATPVEPVRRERGPAVGGTRVGEDSAADAVDYVVHIHGESSIPDSDLAAVMERKFDFGKPVRWLGKRGSEAFWEEITTESHARMANKGGYIDLKGCLQLVDRAGPVNEVTLSEFRDMAENFAMHMKAAASCPDIQKAYAQAVSLDEFCTQVDVMAGINITSRDNSVFTGAKIRVLAETSGFKLGNEGLFHYRDENNATLFSLGNYEPSPFLPENIRTLTTHGVTLLLDVPKVANGEIVFGQMVHLAEVFADALGGIMVDDNRVPMSDSGIRKIRQQLSAIQSMMLARNIPAGGETALRLFA